MTNLHPRFNVIVAFAADAHLSASQAHLTSAERHRLTLALETLRSLGHIAAFRIEPTGNVAGMAEVFDRLHQRLGSFIVETACRSDCLDVLDAPAFLMPAWPFDYTIGGMPASTARFLELELELVATPADEDAGTVIPRLDGAWFVHARPIGG